MPTSLTYIILSPRGCSPWRPDAVMSTARCDGSNSRLAIFKGRQECTEPRQKSCGFTKPVPPSPPKAIPGAQWLRLVNKKRKLSSGLLPTSRNSFVLPHVVLRTTWFRNINLIPFRRVETARPEGPAGRLTFKRRYPRP